MAGHNKWSKIKHIKAKADVKRAKLFSQFAREITVAAQQGGGNPEMNPRLRTAIDNAKAQSMPKGNIERAVKKGTGELSNTKISEITYEGYGPKSLAFVVEVATDNTNRSASDIRTIFAKNNGQIATPGSVTYQFEKTGEIQIRKNPEIEEVALFEAVVEGGGNDLLDGDDSFLVYTAPQKLSQVATNLAQQGYSISSQQLISKPQNLLVINQTPLAQTALNLYEKLEEYEEVLNVFTNFDLSQSLLEQL